MDNIYSFSMAEENVLMFALQIQLYRFDLKVKGEWLNQDLITVKEQKLFNESFCITSANSCSKTIKNKYMMKCCKTGHFVI